MLCRKTIQLLQNNKIICVKNYSKNAQLPKLKPSLWPQSYNVATFGDFSSKLRATFPATGKPIITLYVTSTALTFVSSRTSCSSADSAPVNAAPVNKHDITTLHPFSGLFSRTTWILLEQDMTRRQLDHTQIIYTSLQTDKHASTSPLSFYRPDALPAAQPTVSKHWRH